MIYYYPTPVYQNKYLAYRLTLNRARRVDNDLAPSGLEHILLFGDKKKKTKKPRTKRQGSQHRNRQRKRQKPNKPRGRQR